MTLFEYYIQYMTQICEGTLPAPAGITLTETDEMRRAMELQQQISAMGIPVFVRACAAAAGDEIPQDAYDSFSMEDMLTAAQTLAEQAQQEPAEAEEKPEENTPDPRRRQARLRGVSGLRCAGRRAGAVPHRGAEKEGLAGVL